MAAIAFGAMGLTVAWHWRRGFFAGLLGMALLALGSSGWRASERMADALADGLEGKDLRVTGVVASLPQRSAAGLRFRFEVEAAEDSGTPVQVPTRLAIGWYKGTHDDAALSQPQGELRAGQRWRFTLRLRQPHGNMNPHGFDYELNLFEQGLRATGYVRDAPPPELLERAAGHPVERLRQRVRDAIDASVPDSRTAGVLAALSVGDQGAIERDDWDLGIDNKVLPSSHL
jgi:competence protein ComEC